MKRTKTKNDKGKTRKTGKWSPYLTKYKVTLLQASMENKYFEESINKKYICKMLHNDNWASSDIIHLECISYNKKYVHKAETSFNVTLNNHRQDLKKANAVMACKHFQQTSHNFNKHAKFTIIYQKTNPKKLSSSNLLKD